ncbi:hypothetical protein [Marinobacter sp.]|uniref:hypothetical protein n=1 Tax=Marinobacter sp. TaxID=50741 RepID=UPI00384CA0AD
MGYERIKLYRLAGIQEADEKNQHNSINPETMSLNLTEKVHLMINEIYHVTSRCGAGKSRATIKELIRHILAEADSNRTYLLASKTNPLTEQNFEYAKEIIQEHVNGSELAIKRVDSTNVKGSVVRGLLDLLASGFKGVIFVSHKALASMPAEKLTGVRIVTDEVPQDFAGTLMVQYAAKDSGYPWDDYLIEVPSNHKGYTCVDIHPDADRKDIRRYINAINQNRDTASSQNVADLLTFLMEGYEAAYTTTTQSDGSISRVYQAVHYHRIKELVDHVDFLAILAAQLDETLLGFITQQRLGLSIVEKDVSDSVNLDQKHKNRVRIIPFLENGRWSTTLRRKPAHDSLTIGDKPVGSKISVCSGQLTPNSILSFSSATTGGMPSLNV